MRDMQRMPERLAEPNPAGANSAVRHSAEDVEAIFATIAHDWIRSHWHKARRHPFKHLALPWILFQARRLRQCGRQVAKGMKLGHGPGRILRDILTKIPSAWRHGFESVDILEAVARVVTPSASEACKLWSEIAAESPTVGNCWMAMRSLQKAGRLEEAVKVGQDLAACGHGSQRARQARFPKSAALIQTMSLIPRQCPNAARRVPGRIAYIAASSLPYVATGYATRTYGVTRGYQSIGYDVHVITRPGFPLDVRRDLDGVDVPGCENVDGIPHHRLCEPHKRDHSPLDYIRVASDVIERRLQTLRPEVVIAGSDHMNSLPALIAARRQGLPFVYEVRGMWELSRASREPGFEFTVGYAVSQLLEAFVAARADKVLTLTEPMMRDLVSRGVESSKIALMPNGVDPSFVASPARSEALATRLGVPKGVPVIGYVGSILEYEGLPDLATACAALAGRGYSFRLLIVGSEKADAHGQVPITSSMRRIFDAAGIGDRLIMPGRVPFDEVRDYYSLIDITPITRRPYRVCELVSPIKPVEALAMGKTLIVSDVEALVDFVRGGQTGLTYRKGDVAHLADVLAMAIGDASLRSRLGRAGMDFVRNERTWPRICERAAAHIGIGSARGITSLEATIRGDIRHAV